MIVGGIYKHYKGELYLVLGLARHSETGEIMVVYVPLYVREDNVHSDIQMSVRPMQMFGECVKTDSGEVPRFRHVGGGGQ